MKVREGSQSASDHTPDLRVLLLSSRHCTALLQTDIPLLIKVFFSWQEVEQAEKTSKTIRKATDPRDGNVLYAKHQSLNKIMVPVQYTRWSGPEFQSFISTKPRLSGEAWHRSHRHPPCRAAHYGRVTFHKVNTTSMNLFVPTNTVSNVEVRLHAKKTSTTALE